MSSVLKPFKWFYHEFGLDAIQDTGRNAYIIILARACRMFAHGANSLILALFLAELKFPDFQIGLFMTLTLLGDVFLGGFLTLIADRVGRRKVLIGGSFLMVMTGTVFATVENFWVLLVAAVLGVVSATGGDFGPFRAIEESMLSHLTTPKTRADVLAWYVTTSTLGAAIGTEVAGRVIHSLENLEDWTLAGAYHTLFWLYTAMGLVNAGLTMLLTEECEISNPIQSYSQLPQNEDEGSVELSESTDQGTVPLKIVVKQAWYKRFWNGLSSNLSRISAPTRSIMYKLWFLLIIDSLADGMVPYSLTNYYMDEKFHPAKSTVGDIFSAAYLLGAISTVFAGPMARKIGLVNTMVFTHVPSSAAVLFFPLPPNLVLTMLLLFVRAGLNNMDQAPRSAFIAGVVMSDERTSVLGITSMIRTLAAMTGPTITGLLAGSHRFWIAFVAAGACRLAYDVGLYALFINVKLYQHEGGPADNRDSTSSQTISDGEDMTELDDLDRARGIGKQAARRETPPGSTRNSDDGRLAPRVESGIRRRSPSPSPLTKSEEAPS